MLRTHLNIHIGIGILVAMLWQCSYLSAWAKENLIHYEVGFYGQRLAMVRGKILAYQKEIKVPTKIRVVDMETAQTQRYVYHPDSVDGSYFMLLAPEKNYEVFIEAQGFKPYKTKLYIPQNTYYYEVSHEIEFIPIKLLGSTIGQKVELKKSRYQLVKTFDKAAKDSTNTLSYDFMLSFINYVIQTADQEGLNHIAEMEKFMNEPVFDSNETAITPTSDYDSLFATLDDIFSSANKKKIDNLHTQAESNLQTTFFTQSHAYHNVPIEALPAQKKEPQLIMKHFLVFDSQNKYLNVKHKEDLNAIAELLNQEKSLSVEIAAKVMRSDSANVNRQIKLSARRSRKVFKYLRKNITDAEQFIMVAYGLGERFIEIPDTIQKTQDYKQAEALTKIEIFIYKPDK